MADIDKTATDPANRSTTRPSPREAEADIGLALRQCYRGALDERVPDVLADLLKRLD